MNTKSTVEFYRSKLAIPVPMQERRSRTIENVLEDAFPGAGLNNSFRLDESDAGASDRVGASIAQVRRLKERNPLLAPLYGHIGQRLVQSGEATVKAIIQDDVAFLTQQPDAETLLEIIVRTDGTRPSFVVRDGMLDKTSSPLGEWGKMLDRSAPALQQAFRSIGRIDLYGTHVGTGFLVAPNLIMTNRHVLQRISVGAASLFQISAKARIDFGREYGGPASVDPHRIVEVVFCPGLMINGAALDHRLLDLVLLRIEPVEQVSALHVLGLNTASGWADPDNTIVYVVGYPGMPDMSRYSLDVVDLLFGATFGYKHLSPGRVVRGYDTAPWTVSHDASTTGGSSGSVMLVRTQEGMAAGIHYGGTFTPPRQNWGHILGAVIDSEVENLASGLSLRECLGV